MFHPMLVFERHTGRLLAARLRAGNASRHARIVPMLLRLVPRLKAALPGVTIKLRGDAGSTRSASPPTLSFSVALSHGKNGQFDFASPPGSPLAPAALPFRDTQMEIRTEPQ
jgi:hypothetical protein